MLDKQSAELLQSLHFKPKEKFACIDPSMSKLIALCANASATDESNQLKKLI